MASRRRRDQLSQVFRRQRSRGDSHGAPERVRAGARAPFPTDRRAARQRAQARSYRRTLRPVRLLRKPPASLSGPCGQRARSRRPRATLTAPRRKDPLARRATPDELAGRRHDGLRVFGCSQRPLGGRLGRARHDGALPQGDRRCEVVCGTRVRQQAIHRVAHARERDEHARARARAHREQASPLARLYADQSHARSDGSRRGVSAVPHLPRCDGRAERSRRASHPCERSPRTGAQPVTRSERARLHSDDS